MNFGEMQLQNAVVESVFGKHMDVISDAITRTRSDNRKPEEWLIILIGQKDKDILCNAYNCKSLDGCRFLGLPVAMAEGLPPGDVRVHERDLYNFRAGGDEV